MGWTYLAPISHPLGTMTRRLWLLSERKKYMRVVARKVFPRFLIFSLLPLVLSAAAWGQNRVSAWGTNTLGYVGDGRLVQSNVPVRTNRMISATAIAAGYLHALAV